VRLLEALVAPMSRDFPPWHRLRLPNMRIGEIQNAYPGQTRACGMNPPLFHRPIVSESRLGTHQRKLDPTTIDVSELQVNSYPASEQRLSEIERGRICDAILPMPCLQMLSAGDSIVFALAHARPGQESRYVQCGDSVRVLLTEITDLGEPDPATGNALFRFSWKPPGLSGSLGVSATKS
jgi:hypothetical protein